MPRPTLSERVCYRNGQPAIFRYDFASADLSTMSKAKLDTADKALQINMDAKKYGTFAEIGAGQEVARWFFHVGKASGTVAKTISAYDMAVSDAIYGTAERYVSRKRLQAMLDLEFSLILQRLDKTRGDKCHFFAFADTVATRRDEGHGWLGVTTRLQFLYSSCLGQKVQYILSAQPLPGEYRHKG